MSLIKLIKKHFFVSIFPYRANEKIPNAIINAGREDMLYLSEDAKDVLYPLLRKINTEKNAYYEELKLKKLAITGPFWFENIAEIFRIFDCFIKEYEETHHAGEWRLYFSVYEEGPVLISLFTGHKHIMTYVASPRIGDTELDDIEEIRKKFLRKEVEE